MDTTETYIKMCEKAEEIQKQWRPADWDYCYCRKDKEMVVLSGYDTDAGFYGHSTPAFINPFSGESYWHDFCCSGIDTLEEYKEQHIWLPTQSQLQEMIRDDSLLSPLPQFLTFVFSDFKIARKNNLIQRMFLSKYAFRFTSMEQLWLAFLLAEKYGKYWDGSDWVKEE